MCTISFKRVVSPMTTSKLPHFTPHYAYIIIFNMLISKRILLIFVFIHSLCIFYNYLPHIRRVKNEFDSIPSYIYDDVDNWSMNDFVNVRNGTFVVKINSIILKGEEHVFNCEVSSAGGMSHSFLFMRTKNILTLFKIL